MNTRHEIKLKTTILIHQAIQVREGVIRLENMTSQFVGQDLQLSKVRRGLSKHEIEIKSGDRRPMQGSRSITYENGCQPGCIQCLSYLFQDRLSIHSRNLKH